MRRVLNDNKLEEQFQKNGFVVVPFLSGEEVEELVEQYFKTLDQSGGRLGPKDEKFDSDTEITYDFTFIDKNVKYKELVFDLITKAFGAKVGTYLSDYKPIIANYIHKKEDGGEVPLHQNWSFVDEHSCTSVSIWCPLVDSNKENGTLEVVPGSHKRFGEVRGPMIRSELLDINREIIDNLMEPISIKAGSAVILDDSIVHYSSPNLTNGLRLAIQLILIPNEVSSIHFHMNPSKDKKKVEVLEVDKLFYMNFNPWKKPSDDIKRVRSFQYDTFSLSFDEFKKRLMQPPFDQQKPMPWWKRISAKLSKV